MRLTDLCKPTCNHEHSHDFARFPPLAFRLAPACSPRESPARGRSLKLGPPGRRSEEALDGAPSASVSHARSPRRGEGRAPLGTVLPGGSFETTRRLGRGFRPSERRGGLPLTRSVASRPRGAFASSGAGRSVLADGLPGSQDRCLRSSRQRGRRVSDQRAFPPISRTFRARLHGRFRSRSPASCNRNDSRARPRGPTGPLPDRARSYPRTPGMGGSALARRHRPALHGPGGQGAALAASASSRQSPDELPRNRFPPGTSLHEPAPRPAGGACRVRRRRREDEITRVACSRRIRAGSTARAPDPEGRPPCRPREGEARLAAPEVPFNRRRCQLCIRPFPQVVANLWRWPRAPPPV